MTTCEFNGFVHRVGVLYKMLSNLSSPCEDVINKPELCKWLKWGSSLKGLSKDFPWSGWPEKWHMQFQWPYQTPECTDVCWIWSESISTSFPILWEGNVASGSFFFTWPMLASIASDSVYMYRGSIHLGWQVWPLPLFYQVLLLVWWSAGCLWQMMVAQTCICECDSLHSSCYSLLGGAYYCRSAYPVCQFCVS